MDGIELRCYFDITFDVLTKLIDLVLDEFIPESFKSVSSELFKRVQKLYAMKLIATDGFKVLCDTQAPAT